MILTVDIGNTTVSVCGLEQRGESDCAVLFSAKMDTVRDKSEADYRAELKELLRREGVRPDDVDGAALSSVVPCLDTPMGSCVRALTGCQPVCLSAGSRTGLTLDVKAPEKVGLDRIVDAAWAAAHYLLPAVTVDMGTATTFNVIDEGGVFRGGIIAPGLATGLRALSARAAQLPEIGLETPDHIIGKDTEECMRSGSVAGAAAMIDGLTARIEQELGKPVSLVITGELAQYVVPLCTHALTYDPDLLAKGLLLLYEWNR